MGCLRADGRVHRRHVYGRHVYGRHGRGPSPLPPDRCGRDLAAARQNPDRTRPHKAATEWLAPSPGAGKYAHKYGCERNGRSAWQTIETTQ